MSEILTLPPPEADTGESDSDGIPPLILGPARDAIERVLALARKQLGMEVALVSEFTEDEQVCRNLEGNAESFGLEVGAGAPVWDTYCWRVVQGQLPRVIPDAKSDVRLRDIEATWEADIGSYIGVPIRFSDGRIYGSLCCLSHTADPSLRDRDAEFMTVLAGLIAHDLEAESAAHQKRLETVERIRSVLERGGLRMVFQPILDLASLAIVGYEALARFEGDRASPQERFAEAAEIGLGLDLERAAMQVALAHLGELPSGRFLWMNRSPQALSSSILRDTLASASGDRIIVALTLHETIDSDRRLAEAVHDLRAHGVRLAIDRVGGGYTGLMDVLRLRPDVLKLDPGAIRGMDSDTSQRDLVSFLVRFGSEAGATITADGIETHQTLTILRDLGVSYGQGYALAPPLTLEDLAYEARQGGEQGHNLEGVGSASRP